MVAAHSSGIAIMGRTLYFKILSVVTKNILPIPAVVIGLLLWAAGAGNCLARTLSLLDSIDLAMTRSDQAKTLYEDLRLAEFDLDAAHHQFDTRIVPLASIGFTEGTGNQQLGMEFQKHLPTGTTVNYGLVGKRLNDNSGYVIEHGTTARAFVQVSQGLLRRWGQRYNLAEVTGAELRRKKRIITTERLRQNLILATITGYYDLLLAQQLRVVAEQAWQRSERHLESASSRQKVGLVSKVDVYRAELATLNAQSAYQQLQRQLRTKEADFRELLQLHEEEHLALDQSMHKMRPLIPEQWETDLLASRLDWQAHRLEMMAVNTELTKAELDLQPDLDLSMTVEQMGEGDSAEEALDLDETNWAIQLRILSPLDQFNEKQAVVRKNIEIQRLRRAEQALKRKIFAEVKAAFDDLLMEETTNQLNHRRLVQARMAVDLAKTRYERGISDNLDIIDAEAALSEAENLVVGSLVAYNIAAASLANRLGILDRQWLEISLVRDDGPQGPAKNER